MDILYDDEYHLHLGYYEDNRDYESIAFKRQSELAEKRSKEEKNSISDDSNLGTLVFLNSEEFKTTNESSNDISNYLMSLSFDDVKFISTIMYIGREDSFEEKITAERLYSERYSNINFKTKELDVVAIAEKSSLDEYLRRGIELISSKS